MNTNTPPQKIAVLGNPNIPDALEVAQDVQTFLEERGVDSVAGSLYDNEIRHAVKGRNFDLLIALGGDGTMLRAGHLCAPVDVPLLGINIGHFGFLVEVKRPDWQKVLPKLLQGEYRYEKRMMLIAQCMCDAEEQAVFDVINDVVVARGKYVRPIEVEAILDGSHITSYIADGLIAATPTGSTAYALAAGGPILPPEIRNILLMPIAPHLSIDRAVVLSEGVQLMIKVKTEHEAVVSIDGQTPVPLHNGEGVRITAHEKSLSMIRFEDHGYFYRNLTAYMEHNPLINIKTNDQQ